MGLLTCLLVKGEPLQPWNEQLDLRFATAFGTLGTCGERGLVAPWQAGVCLWAVICPPSASPLRLLYEEATLRSDSFITAVVLFSSSSVFHPSHWNLQPSGSKCVLLARTAAAGLLRYLTKFFRKRQSSTCLGHSSSKSIFLIKSHATERATWRAKVVSLISAQIQRLPCGSLWICIWIYPPVCLPWQIN